MDQSGGRRVLGGQGGQPLHRGGGAPRGRVQPGPGPGPEPQGRHDHHEEQPAQVTCGLLLCPSQGEIQATRIQSSFEYI